MSISEFDTEGGTTHLLDGREVVVSQPAERKNDAVAEEEGCLRVERRVVHSERWGGGRSTRA